MDSSNASGFGDMEQELFEATDTLDRYDHALAEAIRVYRQHSERCTTSRVAQALANHEEAKQTVHTLMQTIWTKLF